MLKIISILLFCFPVFTYGNLLEFGDVDLNDAKFEAKGWVFNIGAEYLEYPVDFPSFVGDYESIGEEKKSTWGLGISFGREFNIYGGLGATITLGGFYNKTANKSVGEAAEDIELELSNLREDYAISGAEAAFAIGYSFDYNRILIKPFVEFAAGSGSSIIEIEYTNRGISTSDPDDNEEYDVKVKEEFLYSKASFGLQFISKAGLLSYMKVTNTNLNKTSREITGDSKAQGTSTVEDRSQDKEKIDESISAFSGSVGLGYIF